MALNPTLRQMVANAHAKYSHEDPFAAKRAHVLKLQQEAEAELAKMTGHFEDSVTHQLVELALRKATKKELLQIVRRAAMAA
jgi:hypothetical protein